MANAKGYRKMAKDPEFGGGYVEEQGYFDGNAVLKVIDFQAVRNPDGVNVDWPVANYEVSVPSADPPIPPVRIIRQKNGAYWTVPDKADRLGRTDAIKVALGRMEPPQLRQPPAFRGRRPVPSEGASRNGVDAGSTRAQTGNGPEVITEPEDDRTLPRGERIIKHLARYPDGADVQTLSAGMFALSSGVIRQHLSRLAKADNGPVVVVSKGVYKRREQN